MQCAENVAQQLHNKSMKFIVKKEFGAAAFEPGGREFESLRARQLPSVLTGHMVYILFRTHS